MSSSKREYHHVMPCPCGDRLTADTEDELVDIAFAHLREKHPTMVDSYEREHIVFMSMRMPKSTD